MVGLSPAPLYRAQDCCWRLADFGLQGPGTFPHPDMQAASLKTEATLPPLGPCKGDAARSGSRLIRLQGPISKGLQGLEGQPGNATEQEGLGEAPTPARVRGAGTPGA